MEYRTFGKTGWKVSEIGLADRGSTNESSTLFKEQLDNDVIRAI